MTSVCVTFCGSFGEGPGAASLTLTVSEMKGHVFHTVGCKLYWVILVDVTSETGSLSLTIAKPS